MSYSKAMDKMKVNEMRKRFYEELELLLKHKRADNRACLSQYEYNSRIEEVKQSKMVLETFGIKKSARDYRMKHKYDVINFCGKERLIKPMTDEKKNVLLYVTNEELFDIIHTAHITIKHGGRTKMISELSKNYCNVTTEFIMLYIRLCEHCQKKNFNRNDSATKSVKNKNYIRPVSFILI